MDVKVARSKILSSFKMHGYSLRSEASKYLTEVLSPLKRSDFETWLEKIIESVEKQPLESSALDKDVIESAVQEINQDGEEEDDKVFNLIDAYSLPRFIYSSDRKKFLPNTQTKPSLHGTAQDKADIFRDRYTILKQRTMRHELFMPATVASANQNASKFELKTLEYLLGSSVALENVIILGMLTQLKEGKYWLEDPTGVVELDMEKALFHTGLYTESCFVLAEGDYDDGVLKVTALGFPPPEPSTVTRAHFGNINFFGGPSPTCVAASEKLKKIEQENQDAMFVFLSDVWLDQPKVMAKLRILFGGYAEVPPTLFVLCGNFCSKPYGTNYFKTMKGLFQDLANLIAEFQSLVENSRFVFVPGPQDPGPGNILPRPKIPENITHALKEKVPFSLFATNPCRIQYCTQEIIIMREDIVNKMCRNCIHLPSDSESVPTHFVKTLQAQAHFCPLPLHVRPVYWTYDNALRIYPLPDLIICADKYDPYNIENNNCLVFNPGSFPRNEFSFKVYWPSSREVEDCKINE
ncbi:DNA polymerase epsilon subunit 2-like [Rhopilema esculentum]|uniref:DNA polymerase epsilon subunit 2-like n=1 Tax=Rhopilema esculentum TaxID=499914 RepID=UPI0031D1C007